MLNAEQMADYERDGFVLVKGVLTPEEAAALRQEAHDVLARINDTSDPTWGSAREAAGGRQTRLQHCHDTQFHSAAFSRLLVDRRWTEVAGQTIGTPNVQLHHTKLFVKPPENGSPFPMHQDHPFFPHTHHRMGAVIFFLDGASEEKGCLRVVPGSYKQGPQEHLEEGSYHLSAETWPPEQAVPVPCEPGDAIFFSYLTVHSSGVNTSSEARTTWLIQYRDPADPPLTDQHTHSLGQGMILAGIDPTGRKHAAAGDATGGPAMGGPAMGVMGTMGG
ncbi:phytanoyl-CoA dioxygenase family protein [Aestuariimicrobium ganziense]|uniref:phytanoyl-CoA dioxygenase family protein n=1 Tax=Aestuariimicrobium ganziense TaxID=2773677 RepID=UPI001942D68E|nr:phytanoyl-CoA dioxygenase family protein [Aestuariimicrobium ganziense]